MTEARPNLSANRNPDNGYRLYYRCPIIKEPVWKWDIPWYFFVRGLAGKARLELSSDEKGTDRVQPQQLGLGPDSALHLRSHGRGGLRSLPKRIVTSVVSLGV